MLLLPSAIAASSNRALMARKVPCLPLPAEHNGVAEGIPPLTPTMLIRELSDILSFHPWSSLVFLTPNFFFPQVPFIPTNSRSFGKDKRVATVKADLAFYCFKVDLNPDWVTFSLQKDHASNNCHVLSFFTKYHFTIFALLLCSSPF